MREQLKIRPGQRVQVLVYGDRVELLPIEAPQALRGVLAGIETDVPRDEDRARMG